MKRRERRALEARFDLLAALARGGAPREVCGLIEWDGRQMTLRPCRNAAQSAETTFLVDPDDQLEELVQIDRAGTEFWGVYHSHPSEGAAPSERDKAFFELTPTVHWVIVGLQPDDGSAYEVWVSGRR